MSGNMETSSVEAFNAKLTARRREMEDAIADAITGFEDAMQWSVRVEKVSLVRPSADSGGVRPVSVKTRIMLRRASNQPT